MSSENQRPLLPEKEVIIPLEIENPPTMKAVESDFSSKLSSKNIFPAGFFSSLTFYWVFGIIKKAKRGKLTLDSLGRVSSEYRAEKLSSEFKEKWYSTYAYEKKNPLLKAILNVNLSSISLLVFWTTLGSLCDMGGIFFFRQVILNFEDKGESLFSLKNSIFLLLVIDFVYIFIKRKNDFLVLFIRSKSTLQLNSLIYDKMLKIEMYNKNSVNEGELMNFIQTDSEKFGDFLSESPQIFILPFQLTFYFFYLFKYFGPYFLIGLVGFIIVLFLISWLEKKVADYQKKLMDAKDDRMKTVTQFLNMIKVIKLYAWEKEFLKRIQEKRKVEVDCLRKGGFFEIWSNMLYWSNTTFLSVISISTYILLGNKMESANILTSLYIFASLSGPIIQVPEFYTGFIESSISLKRLEKFLFNKENDASQIEEISKASAPAIEISSCGFGVDKSNENEKVILRDLSLRVEKGEFIEVIGEVGSGKSCLLNAILNNLAVFSKEKSNNIKLSGAISYVSQTPWILNDTVRNNILFFSEMNEEKYNKIIDLCELAQDIKIFSNGDLTEIGEKGANLSGGQRTRLSLARALYNEADIYLLDDPFSSLDAYVGKRIFERVILRFLKGKTILLVTHGLQYVKFSDQVIYMKNGKIEWKGTPKELENQKFYEDFSKIYQKNKEQSEATQENSKPIEKNEASNDTIAEDNAVVIKTEKETKGRRLSMALWCTFYMYGGGLSYFLSKFFLNSVMKVAEVVSDYYVTYWTSKGDLSKRDNLHHLMVFSGISLAGIMFILLRNIVMIRGKIRYNINMHDTLMDKLIHAPINLFYDTTPRGQIISRLSKDLDMSTRLNGHLNGIIRCFSQIAACMTVCALYNSYTLLIFPVLLMIDLVIIKFYLPGERDLNRLEGDMRPPIIGVFSETIPGIPTIRVYKYERNFLKKFFEKLDSFFKVQLVKNGCDNWFGITLNSISFGLLIFILLFGIAFKDYFGPQAIGLLMAYSLKLIDYIFDGMYWFNLVERLSISAERCDSFTKIVQERTTPEDIQENFLTEGKISFENFSARYRPETPLVLKNINLTIQPGQKIGVVGRTGSGKSTLCLCLFRIIESETGCIKIDDTDISKISIEKLRKNLTVIPQEPILIEGSLRENIDPENSFSDSEITWALKEVGLSRLIESQGLNWKIVENGENLSVGEKQLLCIARAILKKSKIVVMDEATSSIDYKTENLIQKTLENVLKNSTVITIAHRIKTIINYDMILVLNKGEVEEFDSPRSLMNKEKSLFAKLCSESGI